MLARPTAVVAAASTWSEFPTLWKQLLDEVWVCLRNQGINSGCPNVMLFLDDVPHVEVGVEIARPVAPTGRVVMSNLPAGPVARTVHRGSYAGLAEAHRDVSDWCAINHRRAVGPRWEIYGPHREDPAQRSTEVYWLLG